MRVFFFSEQSYHPAWDKIEGPLRISFPTRVMERETTSALLNRYLDEMVIADGLGFDLMVNEHHASLTCMSSVAALPLAVLARQTTRARLLCLGVPMANRRDPLRVAEELAIVDNLSRGRLEFGLVKGSAWELYISNENPVRLMDRLWEAHDLILKAFATLDGPFSWEGKHFQYRYVNVVPPIYQYPHPPIWFPGSGAESARTAAARGYVLASFLNGYVTRATFAAYREAYLAAHGRPAAPDRLAYLGMAVAGHNEQQARLRAEQLRAYYDTVSRTIRATVNPPGYSSVEANARGMLAGPGFNPYANVLPDGRPLPHSAPLEMLSEAGILFWGTPDQVYAQMEKFHADVGGFGNFLCMGQGAYLSHEDTVDSMTLMAREVLPRLRQLPDRSGERREAAE